MKVQKKTQEKELNKMEISNIPDGEFKTLAIRIFTDFTENFNKDVGNIKIKV